MRAVVLNGFGQVDVLAVGDIPAPEPGPGEVLVEVVAAGVNRADLLQRRGYYPPPKGTSETLGLEVSGYIKALGQDVTGWVVGDPVVALLAGGGYAAQVALPAGQCAAPPNNVDLISAGALMEIAATVVSNFAHVNVAAGETILVHGGAGGIGSFAIPYAKTLDVRVITTVGSAAKADYAQSIGADLAIDYHQDWAEAVMQATDGRGVDVVLDIIGAKYLEANVKVLARGGRMVVIGLQGGTKGTLDLNRLLSKGATVTATSLRFRPVADKAAIVAQVASQVWPKLADGTIPLPPISRFALEDVAAAHRQLESGHNQGKIVLTL